MKKPTPRLPTLRLALRPALRAALDRLAARLSLTPTALLSALVAEVLEREGVEPVPPPLPWTSGPRLDESGDRKRVGRVLGGPATRHPKKR